MDIEGFEWPILLSWPEIMRTEPVVSTPLPAQVLVEVHFRTQMTDLAADEEKDFKFPTDMVRLSTHLARVGYITAVNDPNPKCPHCTELTLLRVSC